MAEYKLEKIITVRTAKTIYRDGDKVIKLMGEGYSAPNVLSEALNLAAVGETGLKVPKMVEVTKIDGKWAIVWEYVEGTPLDRLMEKDKDRAQSYLERFVDIQLNMHTYSASWLPSLADKLERKIKASDLDSTCRYELMGRLAGMSKSNKLCHGDFNPSNIVIGENNEVCIIDWSHASQGNTLADAAQTYLLFWLAGNISMADKYLAIFCEKSGTPKRYVQGWLPIVAASRLPSARAEEKEFLLNWTNVVEYV
ncbi:MAG: phosphotransferase [Chitinispirillia bacterium]|nr:phosphotransferase [Chitinispirillia bacterium]